MKTKNILYLILGFCLTTIIYSCFKSRTNNIGKHLISESDLNALSKSGAWIKIPSSLIDSIKNFDYNSDPTPIVAHYFNITNLDTLYKNEQLFSVLAPLYVNIDDSEKPELLTLMGVMSNYTIMSVFKQIGDDWYAIFNTDVENHYEDCEIKVANNNSQNKVFYIKQLEERGSGIYKDAYYFFKLIDGEVYPCLTLLNRSHIYGWGLYINQKISSSFNFSIAGDDRIWVIYDYDFFPGAIYEDDVPWERHEEIQLISEREPVGYEWNVQEKRYIPDFNNGDKGLTANKLACLEEFGNDSLFVNAFAQELKEKLEKGSAEEKRIIKKYIDLVTKDGKAVVPSGMLEQKGETESGLKFYGPKKKN